MYLYANSSAPQRSGCYLGDFGAPPLPSVSKMIFRNKDKMHPDNCCQECQTVDPATNKMTRVPLGVGAFGTGLNVMELAFALSADPANVEYDIKRTKSKSTWERVGGKWANLEFVPAGTADDATDTDECLIPKNKTIFSMDATGFPHPLPAPDGITLKAGSGATSKNASDIVIRSSFAECVIARQKNSGAQWARISSYFLWHSVTWLTRDGRKQWVLDKTRSEIATGELPEAVLKAAPKP